jgi:uncharacterized membrane protein YphA (DoxX/SURF4 family)
MTMNSRNLGYWASTGLVGFAFAAGGLFDLSRGQQIIATFTHLGYPPYLATLLGVWKVLGAVAIVAPRFPRLKEWAYAGIAFDLTGALISHLAAGDGVGNLMPPVVLLTLATASWALRPESRSLARRCSETAGSGQPGGVALRAPLAS